MIIWNPGSCRSSSGRSAAAICNTPRCGRRRSGSRTRPVKFGAVSAEIVAFASQDKYYKSVPERMLAVADAFNAEYHELADAGCPVIQIEEPQIHLAAARGIQDKVITPDLLVEVFNRTVKGLRAKTEVWAHSAGAIRPSSACSPRCRAISRRWKPTPKSTPT